MGPNSLDVLIIGAGPAGLSAALTLARQLHTAVVFDSNVYRNELSNHMHTVATWDHKDPREFRSATRTEILKRYGTISFVDTPIERVEKGANEVFTATARDGRSWQGSRILLATGVRDLAPDIKGYGNCWGRGIYHCLFCHGYEDRGSPSSGVLAIGELGASFPAVALARSARQMTDKVTIYTNGSRELADEIKKATIDTPSILTDNRIVEELSMGENGKNVMITFGDRKTVTEAFLVHKPKTEINGPFARQLALELTDDGDIKANPPFQQTSMKGVFSAGDCASKAKGVTFALQMGTLAGIGIAHDLQCTPGYKA